MHACKKKRTFKNCNLSWTTGPLGNEALNGAEWTRLPDPKLLLMNLLITLVTAHGRFLFSPSDLPPVKYLVLQQVWMCTKASNGAARNLSPAAGNIKQCAGQNLRRAIHDNSSNQWLNSSLGRMPAASTWKICCKVSCLYVMSQRRTKQKLDQVEEFAL